MPNAPRVRMIDEDVSQQATGSLLGISGFVGTFERGPVGVVSDIITSPYELRSVFGGYVNGDDSLLLAERILNRGGNLRILNLRHYSDASNPSTLTAVKAGEEAINVSTDGGNQAIANLEPKYAGAGYNKLVVDVKAPSNGQTAAGYFDLEIYIQGQETYTREVYQNLRVDGKPTALEANWLLEVTKRSKLVDVTYLDTSSITEAILVPVKETLTFTGGSDGDPVTPTDYIGNSAAGTGFYAFDGVLDIYDLAAPTVSDTSVHIAGASYAEARQDIEYLGHLDYSGGTAGIISEREDVTVNSKYYSLFSGGVEIIDPLTGLRRVIPEVADVMGIGAYVDTTFDPWIAQFNTTRGFIPNATGVGLNLGFDNLNLLANRQVNMVVANRGLVYLNGNYTGQFENSKASYRNIVRLLIYIKKSLRPILERYLGEPNDFVTWKQLYNEVSPFLQSLEDGRAVYPNGWQWQGDQYATDLSQLVINNAADVDAGKYKVKLLLNPIGAMNEIELTIGINGSDVEFVDPENL